MNVSGNFAMKGSPRMKVLGVPVRVGLGRERGTKTAAHTGPPGSGVPKLFVFHCARRHTVRTGAWVHYTKTEYSIFI